MERILVEGERGGVGHGVEGETGGHNRTDREVPGGETRMACLGLEGAYVAASLVPVEAFPDRILGGRVGTDRVGTSGPQRDYLEVLRMGLVVQMGLAHPQGRQMDYPVGPRMPQGVDRDIPWGDRTLLVLLVLLA